MLEMQRHIRHLSLPLKFFIIVKEMIKCNNSLLGTMAEFYTEQGKFTDEGVISFTLGGRK